MLQQTQTERVLSKYLEFIQVFPTFSSLVEAPFQQILGVWQGLGYNRRALALKRTAEIAAQKFDGVLPSSLKELKKLPGIGEYTASAVCAFAFQQPTVLIETNIRRVMLYFFYQGKNEVKDKQLLWLVGQTLDQSNPRDWYYALMDYGVMLKQRFPGLNKRSAHYQKQSPFAGSDRQIRGMILKILTRRSLVSIDELIGELEVSRGRIQKILEQLQQDGLIEAEDQTVSLVE
jgi:A/G-specific adenine glycosylase